MKLSIKSIFKNITLLLTFLTILLAVISFMEFQRYHSYDKFNDLLKIQTTVSKISSLNKTDPNYSLILLKSYTSTILNQIQEFNASDFLSGLVNNQESEDAAGRLKSSVKLYEQRVKSYLLASSKQEKYTLDKVNRAHHEVFMNIKSLEELFIQTSHALIDRLQWIVYFTFLMALFTLLFYGKRLRVVYLDIEALYGISNDNALKMKTLTQEAESIRQRMVRKPAAADNPSMIDPVTQIKNYKGMIYSYANKKGTKEKNFTAVCLFEIDNLTQNNDFLQEFVKNVLKKIASILSLYEQATDVVARYDFNQFVFVLSRDTKAKMLQECESIRQSIEELKFKTVTGDTVSFTVSGGFVIKPRHRSLDDMLKEASKLLQAAKKRGGNQIVQIKDYAENF